MTRYYRRVIRITAEDSPNVRLAKEQLANGMEPTGEVVIPGVLPWPDYLKRRSTWATERQCVGLDADFWEGTETMLYPEQWLNYANLLAERLRGLTRQALGIGIDPAEGGDKTSMCAVDRYGIVDLVSRQTPNTAVVTSEAIAFMQEHGVPPERVVFDLGGGGKQHVDRLRAQGYKVKGVAFGQSPTVGKKKPGSRTTYRVTPVMQDDRATYRNLRAEMYGALRDLLDPRDSAYAPPATANSSSLPDPIVSVRAPVDSSSWVGFAIPMEYTNLLSELAPIPLLRDPEGVLLLPPKYRRGKNSEGGALYGKTLVELIGHSPDEADALVLAIHAMRSVSYRPAIRSMTRG